MSIRFTQEKRKSVLVLSVHYVVTHAQFPSMQQLVQ